MAYCIQKVHIEGLWGAEKPVDLELREGVNILIGRNGCGKTTILRLLHGVLAFDVQLLAQIRFSLARLTLQVFGGDETEDLVVDWTAERRLVQYSWKGKVWRQRLGSAARPSPWRPIGDDDDKPAQSDAERFEHLRLEVVGLVPLAWLPVSRRLPVPGDDDDDMEWAYRRARHRHGERPESVDRCLAELLTRLKTYRLQLDSKCSALYKGFERSVLQLMLLEKGDKLELYQPSADDKTMLVNAFRSADLLDSAFRSRIDTHFELAEEAFKEIQGNSDRDLDTDLAMSRFRNLLVAGRTRRMAEHARELETKKNAIFSPVETFSRIASKFLHNKDVSVTESGDLTVEAAGGGKIPVDVLSSGEKQILIMLITALLYESEPVVYIADEPELSLHVEWQERLLPALLELGREMQLIVATHSPDIVGKYEQGVIRLG